MPTVEAVAERFVGFVKAEQPRGPYLLTGYSLGGRIGFEMLRRLGGDGMLVMLDTPAPGWPPPLPLPKRIALFARRAIKSGPRAMVKRVIAKFRPKGRHSVPEHIFRAAQLPAGAGDAAARARQDDLVFNYLKAAFLWRAQRSDFPITLLRTETDVRDADVSDRTMGWSKLTTAAVRVESIPGNHGTIFHEPHVRELARKLAEVIRV
jgi:thioesterase domain-containing protein